MIFGGVCERCELRGQRHCDPDGECADAGTHTDENADRNGNAVADADGYTRTSRFSRANQNLLLRR